MKNTLYDGYQGQRLSREEMVRRIRGVARGEMTELQWDTLVEYYGKKKKVAQIARERGVRRSTVYRTLHRAEGKIRKYLRY